MSHDVSIRLPGPSADRYTVLCETCGEVGTADDFQLAELIRRLHQALDAIVVPGTEMAG